MLNIAIFVIGLLVFINILSLIVPKVSGMYDVDRYPSTWLSQKLTNTKWETLDDKYQINFSQHDYESTKNMTMNLSYNKHTTSTRVLTFISTSPYEAKDAISGNKMVLDGHNLLKIFIDNKELYAIRKN